MRTTHQNRIRDALWRLTAPSTPHDPVDAPPLFLRTPSIALLWVATLTSLVGLLALSRIRFPRDRDAAVAIESTRHLASPASTSR